MPEILHSGSARLTSTGPEHDTYRNWHNALCHPASISSELYSDGKGIPSKPRGFHYKECALSKSVHHVPRGLSRENRLRPFELIHTDLSGKFSSPSLGKGLYYMTFVDECTRFVWVTILQVKDDVIVALREFIAMVKRQFSALVARVRCDGGGEYVGVEARGMLRSMGIILEVTPPYSPESNGVAERLNRTLKQMVRAMLLTLHPDVRRYMFLWAEAVSSAVYIKNRLRHSTIGITPYEALYGSKPPVSHLRPFGSKCYVHIRKEARPAGTQLHPRAFEALMVGYASTDRLYRVYVPSKRTVVSTNQVRFRPSGDSSVPSGSRLPEGFNPDDYERFNIGTTGPTAPLLGPPEHFNPDEYKKFEDGAFLVCNDEPVSYEAALWSPDGDHWEVAVQSELDALRRNYT